MDFNQWHVSKPVIKLEWTWVLSDLKTSAWHILIWKSLLDWGIDYVIERWKCSDFFLWFKYGCIIGNPTTAEIMDHY
jgi:hypothetical protein